MSSSSAAEGQGIYLVSIALKHSEVRGFELLFAAS